MPDTASIEYSITNRTHRYLFSFTARGRALQSSFLDEAVVFEGGSCPSLPAGRDPSVGVGTGDPANGDWTLVDFCKDTGSEQYVADPAVAPDCHVNDDDSSFEDLTFMFNMFGVDWSKVFINTNGHITLGGKFSTFTPLAIPFSPQKMIAAYWADIDLAGGGYIWKQAIPLQNTLVLAWDNVGYFNANPDKRATFSMMISDGSNPDMGIGNNVCFCYQTMGFTTGDVSGGVDGFGGAGALVGVNNGDGVNYSELGQFFDPAGLEGLENTSFCFSVEPENIAPVPTNFPTDGSIVLGCKETIDGTVVEFKAPEVDQTTTLTVTGDAGVPGLSVVIADGAQSASATITFIPVGEAPYGTTLTFTATDSEGGETVVDLLLSFLGCDDGGGGGDPHFTMWNGDKFDFHGECDLVLVSNPEFADGLGMHVHGRTKIHHDWSAFESTAIKIGDDIFEVKGKTHWMNGVENAELPVFLGDFKVDQPTSSDHGSRYVVHLGDGERIFIKTYDEFLWVGVEGPRSADFAHTHGLLGVFGGAKLARDGKTVMSDTNTFGQEWQVHGDTDPQLFHTLQGPQWPNKCVMPAQPKPEGRVARHLRMTVAKEACAHVAKKKYDDCVADVVATNDVTLAQAY
ncbi:MAG: hypothetical protein SGILL_001621 [Bacillariaceae sp.]